MKVEGDHRKVIALPRKQVCCCQHRPAPNAEAPGARRRRACAQCMNVRGSEGMAHYGMSATGDAAEG